MNSTAHDIAIYLSQMGIGRFPPANDGTPWAIGVNGEVVSPSDAVTIYDTGGTGQQTDDAGIIGATLQVRTRAVDFAEGHQKQEDVLALLTQKMLVLSTSFAVSITMTSGVMSLGADDKGRHLMVSNYSVVRAGLVPDPDYDEPEDWSDVMDPNS